MKKQVGDYVDSSQISHMRVCVMNSPLFDNPGIRLQRTIARGFYVDGHVVNLERIVGEENFDVLDDAQLVDLIEGTLMHYGFIPQEVSMDGNDRSLRFGRAEDEITFTFNENYDRGNGKTRFTLEGDVDLREKKQDKKSSLLINYSEKDIINLITRTFEDREFFERFAGMPRKRMKHLGVTNFSRRALETLDTFKNGQQGSLGARSSEGIEPIYLNGKIKQVNVSSFLPVVNRKTARREDGIPSLGGLSGLHPFPYGDFTRFNHEVGAHYVTLLLCNKFSIEGERRTKIAAYGLCHDDGHLVFGHPGEDYFKYKFRKEFKPFDHEATAKYHIQDERAEFDLVLPGLSDMLVALIDEEDSDHILVTADLGGSDRTNFLASDPWHLGKHPDHNALDIIKHLGFDGRRLWCGSPDEAFKFLNLHGIGYEENYFGPANQLSDGFIKKIMYSAGFEDVNDQIPIERKDVRLMVPIWQLNNPQLTRYLCNEHPEQMVREMTRYWSVGFHSAPMATVSQLKRKGYEHIGQDMRIANFDSLSHKKVKIQSQGIDPDELAQYYKFWRHPDNQHKIEVAAAKRLKLPYEWIVVAAAPHVAKFSSSAAPVKIGNKIISLYDIDSKKYRTPFIERANKMQGLRLGVHPRIHSLAQKALEKTPFYEIIKDVYEQRD